MQKKIFKKITSGFSLIELSIVILVIGIIIVGIIGGKKLIESSNISKARALTNSSPVSGIEDLVLWLEASSKNSFSTSQPSNQTATSLWNDINPQQTAKNNAVQTTSANQPKYIVNAINGLPAIRFDGSDDYMKFDSENWFDKITNHTIFIVAKSNSTQVSPDAAIFGKGNGFSSIQMVLQSDNLFLYKIGDNVALYGTGAYSVTAASTNVPFIVSGTFSDANYGGTGNINFYLNGVLQGNASFSNSPRSTDSVSIGAYFNGTSILRPFNGDVGEIIMFSRTLSDFERNQIELYLSKKWGIKLP